MGRREKEVPEEEKAEICNLNANENMGSKKISKLERFKLIGYNKIGRIIKKDCPRILGISGTSTNGTTPPVALSGPPVTVSKQTSAGSRSSQATPNDSRTEVASANSNPFSLGSFSSGTLDSTSDSDNIDYDQALHPDNYYRPTQPSYQGLIDPVKAAGSMLNSTWNSRVLAWASEIANRFTQQLFPSEQQNPHLEKLSNLFDKYLKRKEDEKQTDELNDEDDPAEESSSNCSCALTKQISTPAVTHSDQKGSPITESVAADSEDWRTKIMTKLESIRREREKRAQQRNEELGKIQDGIDRLWRKLESKETEMETMPISKTDSIGIQEQNDQKNGQSKSLVDNSTGPMTVPPDPSPPGGISDSSGASIQSGIVPPPHTVANAPSEGAQTLHLESTPSTQASIKESPEQKEQLQEITAQSVNGNIQAPKLQPVDPVNSGQQQLDTFRNSGPQCPLTRPNSPRDNHQSPNGDSESPDGKGEDSSELAQSQGRTGMNQHNIHNPSDLPLIALFVLDVATIAGLFLIDQKKNKQPEVRQEIGTLQDPRFVDVNEKPRPPSLYSVQPQGDAANGFHIF